MLNRPSVFPFFEASAAVCHSSILRCEISTRQRERMIASQFLYAAKGSVTNSRSARSAASPRSRRAPQPPRARNPFKKKDPSSANISHNKPSHSATIPIQIYAPAPKYGMKSSRRSTDGASKVRRRLSSIFTRESRESGVLWGPAAASRRCGKRKGKSCQSPRIQRCCRFHHAANVEGSPS